jgi:chromosomal replication initiator protein
VTDLEAQVSGVPLWSSRVYQIVAATAEAFGLGAYDLLGKDRSKSVKEGRLAAYVVARRCTRLSYPELGRAFGRNHTTVLTGVRSMGAKCARDPGLAELVEQLVERFGEVAEKERDQ